MKYQKINKEEFLKRVTERLRAEHPNARPKSAFSPEDVAKAMCTELLALVEAGYKVSFTGFGSFYMQLHKGHPVQFGSKIDAVKDYRVMKFSASNVLNKKLRQDDTVASNAV